MTDVLDDVRDHYRASGLTERLKTALTLLGPEDQRLTPQQLGALDQFHTRGLAATAELAKLTGIAADMSVLDVGSGVGGPARFLAATYGCRVTGVDLSEPFVEAARYLTERTGQSRQVSFQAASATPRSIAESSLTRSSARTASALRNGSRAALRVAVIRIPAVDDGVARREQGNQVRDRAVGDRPGRHHQPNHARRLQFRDHLFE